MAGPSAQANRCFPSTTAKRLNVSARVGLGGEFRLTSGGQTRIRMPSTSALTRTVSWLSLPDFSLACPATSSTSSSQEILRQSFFQISTHRPLTSPSSGAHIAACVMLKILETQLPVPRPTALVLTYATLDFNFTSWMTPANLRVLHAEQSSGHIPGLAAQKDHYKHISPLSMVGDHKPIRRRRSWRDALRTLTSPGEEKPSARSRAPALAATRGARGSRADARMHMHATRSAPGADETGELADAEDDADMCDSPEEEKPLHARVRFHPHVDEVFIGPEQAQKEAESPSGSGETLSLSLGVQDTPIQGSAGNPSPLGTRLTMTSRTGYFQDRIISPSMVSLYSLFRNGVTAGSGCTR